MLYTTMRLLSGWVLRVAFRMKVTLPANIPSEGALVVVANHESLLDGFVVAAALDRRRLTFLSASYLFDMPVVGWFLRAVGALPVKKGGNNLGSLRRAIAVLEQGETVAVFPEGGTTSSEILGGAVYLAMKAKAPLLPLHIAGTEKALPPGRVWPSFTPIEVSIGGPFCVSDIEARHVGTRRAVSEGKQVLERALGQVRPA